MHAEAGSPTHIIVGHTIVGGHLISGSDPGRVSIDQVSAASLVGRVPYYSKATTIYSEGW